MRAGTASFVVLAIFPILGSLGKTIPEVSSLRDDFTVVEIPDGKILGTENVTVDKHTPYFAFRGIPFAEPPLGDLRFAAPVKNQQWSGFWDGTEDAEVCVQGSGDNVRGSEDCLYVNVYTPSLTKKNLPVMVWIHGGSFTGGSSQYRSFGPDYFLEEEVIFASFNYRVGILGFLSTEDKNAPGNWGLKDQVLALKWIKENIQYFGGDPEKITIFGESAGGASVSYLMQIPQAQGLFNAAIIQSGTSEMLWALSTKARDTAFRVGRDVGVVALLSSTLVKRLRDVDAYTLQKSAMSVFYKVYLPNPFRGLPFSPCIEVEHEGAVFTKKSDDYLRSGEYPSKVPILIGHTSNEGGSAHGLPENFRTALLYFDITSDNLAPYSLTQSSALKKLAANKIKLHYFGTGSISSQLDQVVEYVNADQFNRGTRRVAENVAPFAPVYFYVFGYEGTIVGNNSYTGVGHAEDLVYLFRTYTDNYTPQDLEVRAKLIRLWTNFAKTSNPTPSAEPLLDNVIWKPVNPSSQDLDFVWINSTLIPDQNPDQEAWSFYQDVFDEFGDGSYTTY